MFTVTQCNRCACNLSHLESEFCIMCKPEEKHVFDPEDFEGSGQMLVRGDYDGEDHFFGSSVAYKVGYIASNRQVLLISLADGMALQFDSKEQLCETLNKHDKGYRPLTMSEVSALTAEIGTRFW